MKTSKLILVLTLFFSTFFAHGFAPKRVRLTSNQETFFGMVKMIGRQLNTYGFKRVAGPFYHFSKNDILNTSLEERKLIQVEFSEELEDIELEIRVLRDSNFKFIENHSKSIDCKNSLIESLKDVRQAAYLFGRVSALERRNEERYQVLKRNYSLAHSTMLATIETCIN